MTSLGRWVEGAPRTQVVGNFEVCEAGRPEVQPHTIPWSPASPAPLPLPAATRPTLLAMDFAATWKPTRTLAECNQLLQLPGSPFVTARGLVDGRVLRYYTNLPGGGTLKKFWEESALHGDKE